MDFLKLVSQTRTIHSFKPGDGPTEEQLLSSLECCLMAPNHKRSYPWRIIRVKDETRQKIASIAYDQKKVTGASEEECELSRNRNLAPKDLVVFVLKNLPEDTFREREDYATLSCSIQLLALNLRELGFGYKWSTGKLSRCDEVKQVLELGQNDEVIGFIWIGKEASEIPSVTRPDLGEVLQEI